MESILQNMVGANADAALNNLRDLVAAVRPKSADDSTTAVNNVRALSFLLEQNPQYRTALRAQLDQLMGNTRQVQLYTDTGILSNEPLVAGLRRRIGERLLPVKPRPELLKDVFGLLFHRKDDYVWLGGIPYGVWADLSRSLILDIAYAPDRYSQLQRLEAIQVLSCRIATIGLEPELVQNAPDMERFESPFVRQNVETLSFVENYRKALVEEKELDDDQKQIMVLLDQCTAQIARIRKHALRHGVSVSLTYHLLRLEQHIERMQILLELVDPVPSPNWGPAFLRLFLQLVRAENRKHSLRDVLRQNTELLALQVTEHASHTGEHYIAENRREWLNMFRSAAGAGIIVGFMALFKIQIAKAHLPPLIEAVSFGLNYALGFMLVHMLHCTIATKQPAMTAATIAATLPPPGSKSAEGYRELVELIVKVARTQFIAILGNVLLAMPVALGLAWLWAYHFGEPLINLDKTGKLLHELRPLTGLGVPHAAIAGVWLFLAGLISGYYDNKALYHRLPERIAAHPLLNRVLGEHRSWKLGKYIEHNLGALAGNFYFGMMLGLTGFIGFLIGLPLDIRHITFSSANVSFIAAGVNFNLDWQILLLALWGVALIGLTNLAVSFTLALWTAMRSRQRLLSELRPLFGMLVRRFFRRPQDFLFAPRQPKPAADTAAADEGKA
ncbi:site-specific recombinase [Chitinilyticum aquatile]|uniref:site-specific recombinase n=1 Tax=Chitinilyticum aquatile TaxID=362520 RepID=UPI00042317B8|nr:site-specific recombinase [Chitinilyticum aquatile]